MSLRKWVILLLAAVLLAGCGSFGRLAVGPTVSETEVVELGTAETARVEVKMGVGELEIGSGAADLFEGTFTYNIENWKPVVSYDVRGSEGRLVVSMPETNTDGFPDDSVRYEWDLAFNEDVPLDMSVELGVGESDLTFSDLLLTDLTVRTGVGKTTIDLGGDWRQSFDVNIEGGVGEAIVVLPRNVGVRVEPTTGLGSVNVFGLVQDGDVYTNEAYETAEVKVDVRVRGGIGTIRLELEGR